MTFAPDGQTLAVSSNDISIWRVSDGACLQTFTNVSGSMAFAPDGLTMAACSGDTIFLLRVSDGSCLQTFTGHIGSVYAVAFAPDGQTLASGSEDDTIKLWQVSDGACLRTLTGHTFWVSSVAFDENGQILASGSNDHTVKLWDVNQHDANYGACLQTLNGYTDEVASVAFAPDGQTLLTGGWEGLALWNLSSPLSAVTLTPSVPSPQPVNTSITLTAAATGGANVQYQFWVYNQSAVPTWSQLQAYSTSATCTWTPSAPGNYLLSATAQDGFTGAEVNATLWYGIMNSPLTGVTLQASLPSPQPTNTSVCFTAQAIGGTNVQYDFWIYDPQATPAWGLLHDFSTSNSGSLLFPTPCSFMIAVTAQDGITGTEVNTTLWYAITNTPLTGVTVQPSPTSPQAVATPITFTADGHGRDERPVSILALQPDRHPVLEPITGVFPYHRLSLDAHRTG